MSKDAGESSSFCLPSWRRGKVPFFSGAISVRKAKEGRRSSPSTFPWVKMKRSVNLLVIWLALGKGEGKGIGFFFRQPRREGDLSYDYYHPTMMTQE